MGPTTLGDIVNRGGLAVESSQQGFSTYSQVFIQAMSAFFGAFFGFISVAVKDAVTRSRERKKQYHNALVTLVYEGNRVLLLLEENLHEVAAIKEYVAKTHESPIVPLPINQCKTIPFEPEIINRLGIIDLVNDVFQYQEHLRKFNGSITGLNRHFDLFSSALLAQTVHPRTYLMNLDRYISGLDQIVPFTRALYDETVRLSAGVRVLLRLKRYSKSYPPGFPEMVQAEIGTLRKEIEDSRSQSKKRIDRIIGTDAPKK